MIADPPNSRPRTREVLDRSGLRMPVGKSTAVLLGLCVAMVVFVGCGEQPESGGNPRVDITHAGRDPVRGQQLFQQTCSSCHGGNAQGLPHSGASLRKSVFVAGANDERLLQFVKTGRLASDPENRSGVLMPPSGGSRTLDDLAILDIIAHLRNVQQQAKLDPPDDDAQESIQ